MQLSRIIPSSYPHIRTPTHFYSNAGTMSAIAEPSKNLGLSRALGPKLDVKGQGSSPRDARKNARAARNVMKGRVAVAWEGTALRSSVVPEGREGMQALGRGGRLANDKPPTLRESRPPRA